MIPTRLDYSLDDNCDAVRTIKIILLRNLLNQMHEAKLQTYIICHNLELNSKNSSLWLCFFIRNFSVQPNSSNQIRSKPNLNTTLNILFR